MQKFEKKKDYLQYLQYVSSGRVHFKTFPAKVKLVLDMEYWLHD